MEAVRAKLATYCQAHHRYQRIKTREVNIGGVPMGGNHPIRIQSMTTTDTMDTQATVDQTLRLVEAGCEYVRITAPSKKEAENLAEIKKILRAQGCQVPLVADIHYTPNAAEIAARIIEKVRVNPGNYADKKRFQTLEYTDESYQAELDRIYKRFSPLVKICKEEGTVMRIGTNHGSLSDRIMSRYGDTPRGMVESALEFVRICEDHNFHDIVISMKASNPQVMVQAYRMLMAEMRKRGEIYPLHLGVTEAGEGEDGRIKSALGIATLLMDGMGDTVRVSLTEEPEHEIPVARFLVSHFHGEGRVPHRDAVGEEELGEKQEKIVLPFDPYAFQRRSTREELNLGGGQVPRVVCDLSASENRPESLQQIGYTYVPLLDKYNFSDIASDFVFLGDTTPTYELPGGLKAVYHHDHWQMLRDRERSFPFFQTYSEFLSASSHSKKLNFVQLDAEGLEQRLSEPTVPAPCVWVLPAAGNIPAYEWRRMIYRLTEAGDEQPVILKVSRPADFSYYSDDDLPAHLRITEEAKMQLHLASELSTMLVDGLVDGVWVEKADQKMLSATFGCLQLSRLRITKTEYISCPSCGRTLFDLQETTARIRERTEHLKGVKIGIMGCIVNGPGEMADADFGYVGTGVGKISLYRGQEVVKRNVPTAQAVDELIELIKSEGQWVEPSEEATA
jgi:(E)-4-hydroxy-3-methylbut-2-enyl-diphosphate synthase